MERKLILRADKVAFMEIESDFNRMRGFKNLANAKNPKEYTRQYVDERSEVTDVVGMSESREFEFDQYTNDPVHNKMVEIFEDEKLGDDAKVSILTVDKNKDAEKENNAILRSYTVIPDASGDGVDAYVYTGRFTAAGPAKAVKATISEDGLTATVTSGV